MDESLLGVFAGGGPQGAGGGAGAHAGELVPVAYWRSSRWWRVAGEVGEAAVPSSNSELPVGVGERAAVP